MDFDLKLVTVEDSYIEFLKQYQIDILPNRKEKSRHRRLYLCLNIGDILYSTVRPYLHNMCIVNQSFSHQPIASTGFAALTCHTGFYNKFLFYYLM